MKNIISATDRLGSIKKHIKQNSISKNDIFMNLGKSKKRNYYNGPGGNGRSYDHSPKEPSKKEKIKENIQWMVRYLEIFEELTKTNDNIELIYSLDRIHISANNPARKGIDEITPFFDKLSGLYKILFESLLAQIQEEKSKIDLLDNEGYEKLTLEIQEINNKITENEQSHANIDTKSHIYEGLKKLLESKQSKINNHEVSLYHIDIKKYESILSNIKNNFNIFDELNNMLD